MICDIDLAHAFSMLVQEESRKMVTDYGWMVIDLGRSPGGFNDLPSAAFVVRVGLPKLEDKFVLGIANRWSGQEHFFRVETSINHGLINAQYPWEQAYIGKAHVVLRVWYSKSQHSVWWPVGLSPPTTNDHSLLKSVAVESRLNDVCKRIVWHIDDPKCQEGLVGKLHRAIGIYLMTHMLLPDH